MTYFVGRSKIKKLLFLAAVFVVASLEYVIGSQLLKPRLPTGSSPEEKLFIEIPLWELRCLTDLLSEDYRSINMYNYPDDPRLTTYRLRCQILERYIETHPDLQRPWEVRPHVPFPGVRL